MFSYGVDSRGAVAVFTPADRQNFKRLHVAASMRLLRL
ncbi:hypothetical protein EDO6_03092 [Paenibacillus xylanexedens]|nr:hypothetical protein EDO6_03092 [Paenibacillus xylanexedens]